ncbi:hypothetical protein TNIN_220031, partial [Trichonephila inaurata madagascariensis]
MPHRTDGRWRIWLETSETKYPANLCRDGPDWRWEHYGLQNVFLTISEFTHYCGWHDGSKQ